MSSEIKIAHISVKCIEGHTSAETYAGVEVYCRQGKSKGKLFMTGDFPNDYMSANAYVAAGDYDSCMLSSSVDHFTMDTKGEFVWHSNRFVGEYPVRAIGADGRWDKLNVQRTKKKGRRDMYVLNDGDVVVVDQANGKFKIFTPDGEPIEKPGPLVQVLGNAARMKRKVVWEYAE